MRKRTLRSALFYMLINTHKGNDMQNEKITVREARSVLFSINCDKADALRRELFNVYEQDKPLAGAFLTQFEAITKPRKVGAAKEQKIKQEALSKIEALTIAELCKAYEDTNTMRGDHVPDLRDWYMYALEGRNEAAFIAWMETGDIDLMDKPSFFFT